jgi:PDZ domain
MFVSCFVPNRLTAIVLLVITLTALRCPAQTDDGPVKMEPELALAIPLVLKGRDVMVKYPILINRTTVIKPGMILRVLYIPPVQNDSEDLALAHKGNMEQSFSRTASSDDSDAPKMSPEMAHFLEGERREVWEVPVNFQLALAQLPTDSLHLIYSMSGDNRNLDDQRWNFFEGLFLGSPSGGVSVLAVEIGSKAANAGFKVGDQILAVGGINVPNLESFPDVYTKARQNAKDMNAESFSFVVKSTGESGNHTLKMAMPPTIKSQLMDGF